MSDELQFDKNDNGLTLVKCNNSDLVVIPEIYNGRPITIIGSRAFNNRVKKVVLPDSIEVIESMAFWYCNKLESVTFSQNLKIIKKSAFYSCVNLTEISLPKSVEMIGFECFSYCKNLKKFKAENPLIKISSSIFIGCDNLVEVDFHLIKFLDFSIMVKLIRKTIVDNLNEKSEVINYIKSKNILKRELLLSNDSMIINKLIENKIPISLELIEELLPYHIQQNNTSITAILLEYKEKNFSKKEVKAIQERIELLEIGLEPYTLHEFNKIFNCSKKDNIVSILGYRGDDINVTIPDELADNLKIRELSKNNSTNYSPIQVLNIQACIKKISPYAFSYNITFIEVVLPETLVVIQSDAFYNCINLTKINLPCSLKKISYGVFENCMSLEEIFIPNSVEYLGKQVFSGCKKLKKVDLQANITTIESYTFFGCENLQEITIPASVKIIKENAFQNCINLEKIKFLGEVPEICKDAFLDTKINL